LRFRRSPVRCVELRQCYIRRSIERAVDTVTDQARSCIGGRAIDLKYTSAIRNALRLQVFDERLCYGVTDAFIVERDIEVSGRVRDGPVVGNDPYALGMGNLNQSGRCSGIYRINPRQRLLRVEFAVDPRRCRPGDNLVRIRLASPATQDAADGVVLEKLEVHVQYAEP
jgi:hypothetical protein